MASPEGIDPEFAQPIYQAQGPDHTNPDGTAGRGVHPYRFPSSMQLKSALAAVKAGADPAAVRQRLIQNGIDPRGI